MGKETQAKVAFWLTMVVAVLTTIAQVLSQYPST